MKNDILQTVLERKISHVPTSSDMNAKCDWCGEKIVHAGLDNNDYTCINCNAERDYYIQECLLEWELIVERASTSKCADTRRQVVGALQGFVYGWEVRIRQIMEGKG